MPRAKPITDKKPNYIQIAASAGNAEDHLGDTTYRVYTNFMDPPAILGQNLSHDQAASFAQSLSSAYKSNAEKFEILASALDKASYLDRQGMITTHSFSANQDVYTEGAAGAMLGATASAWAGPGAGAGAVFGAVAGAGLAQGRNESAEVFLSILQQEGIDLSDATRLTNLFEKQTAEDERILNKALNRSGLSLAFHTGATAFGSSAVCLTGPTAGLLTRSTTVGATNSVGEGSKTFADALLSDEDFSIAATNARDTALATLTTAFMPGGSGASSRFVLDALRDTTSNVMQDQLTSLHEEAKPTPAIEEYNFSSLTLPMN